MPSLRKATLLSLLASIPSIRAQATTSTWGEPFSVDSPSTQNLLPTSVLVSSAASVASSQAATLETGSPSRSSAGSEETGTTSTSAGASITTGTVGAQSTGAAPTPYVRMGVMGVIAGAAGVLMV